MFMNEWDVENAVRRYSDDADLPNLGTAARTLSALVDYVNSHSDGWPYWTAAQRAAKGLTDALQSANDADRRGEVPDMSKAALVKALASVKRFLTKNSVEHAQVLR
jgi:hypothetical protein